MTEPQPKPSSCSVCGAQMPVGAERCPSCGVTHDKRHTCPFCGIVAQPQPHSELLFACPSCGAPRIPLPSGLTATKKQNLALTRARAARSSRSTWRVATGLGTAFGIFAVLLLVGVSAIVDIGLFPLLAAGLITVMPLVFAAFAWHKAGQENGKVRSSLDEAWLEATKEVASTGTVRKQDLVDTFHLEEDVALGMIARFGAHHSVSTSINEEGELELSTGRERVRVETPAERPPAGEEVEMELDSAESLDAKVQR